MARTSEEFDAFYKEHGGDPWKCDAPHVQKRLDESLELLKRFVPEDFPGAFVELGPFHGHFTRRLLANYPVASVCGFEISPVAAEALRNQPLPGSQRLTIHVQDALGISASQVKPLDPVPVIVALEVIYYLQPAERETCIANLKKQFPASLWIMSGPIIGGNYFDEATLLNICWSHGLGLAGLWTHNFRSLLPADQSVTQITCNQSTPLRRQWANQVSYLFRPAQPGDLPPE